MIVYHIDAVTKCRGGSLLQIFFPTECEIIIISPWKEVCKYMGTFLNSTEVVFLSGLEDFISSKRPHTPTNVSWCIPYYEISELHTNQFLIWLYGHCLIIYLETVLVWLQIYCLHTIFTAASTILHNRNRKKFPFSACMSCLCAIFECSGTCVILSTGKHSYSACYCLFFLFFGKKVLHLLSDASPNVSQVDA